MSENLPKLFTESFTTNLRLNLQQEGSILRGLVTEGHYVGKQAAVVDYNTAIQSRVPAGRFAPIGRVDADYQRRWVVPMDRDLPQLFDNFDKLRTIQDPQSVAVTNASYAFGRDWDDAIINAAFATALISNTDGTTTTTESFSTSSYGVSEKFGNGSTSIGFTVEKMREVRRIFRRNHVDLEREKITLISASQQESEMYSLAQITSAEFNGQRPVLVDGSLHTFLGMNLRFSERLQYGTGIGSSSNCRFGIAFVQTGMHLGIWQDMTHSVDRRTDLSGLPWQLYSMHTFGATRLEPGRLVRVDFGNDSNGADINP